MAPIEYIDRSTGERVVESVMGDGALGERALPMRRPRGIASLMTVSLCCRLFLSHFSSAVENYNLHGMTDMGLKMVNVG